MPTLCVHYLICIYKVKLLKTQYRVLSSQGFALSYSKLVKLWFGGILLLRQGNSIFTVSIKSCFSLQTRFFLLRFGLWINVQNRHFDVLRVLCNMYTAQKLVMYRKFVTVLTDVCTIQNVLWFSSGSVWNGTILIYQCMYQFHIECNI